VGRRLWLIIKHTWRGYNRDNCNQLAAAIAYYVLFSIVPLAIVAVFVFSLVLRDASLKNDVVDSIVNALALSDTDGRDAVESAINGLQAGGGIAAVIGVAGALWASSAVFGSIRRSLNAVWGVYERRPYAQAKLVDFLQIGGLGMLFLTSITITGFVRAVRDASLRYGGPLSGHNQVWEVPALVVPGLLTFVALFALYVLVPTARPRARDAWIGAAVAAVMFEVVKNAFAFYVSHFNNFNVVYGSLAGVFLFLFSTFLASNVLLIGAEIACAVGEMRDGVYDAELHAHPQPHAPVATRAFRMVKGLFVRQ
jgi:membrane protein